MPIRGFAVAACFVSLLGMLGCRPLVPQDWESSHFRSHPLVGRIYSVEQRRFVEPEALFKVAARSPTVLIGEQHDNTDHHRLQAEILSEMIVRGRRPSLSVEQIDLEKQPELDRARVESPTDVDAIAAAVDWDRSGWPPWPQYRPVFAEAVTASLPIRAANLSRSRLGALFSHGGGAQEGGAAALRLRLSTLPPLGSQAGEALIAQVVASHCGMLDEAAAQPMVDAQRLRDSFLAASLLRREGAEAGDGAVLIAGLEHVRRDYGVLSTLEPEQLLTLTPVVTIALVQVQPDLKEPGNYAELFSGELPFDFLWFTPTWNIEDPCERFEEQLRALKAKGPGA